MLKGRCQKSQLKWVTDSHVPRVRCEDIIIIDDSKLSVSKDVECI